MKVVIPNKKLYEAPEGNRAAALLDPRLLMLTCTGVSFAHGSNDGQKGMGLIMLILVGTVPTAYALNRAVTPADVQDFIAVSRAGEQRARALRAARRGAGRRPARRGHRLRAHARRSRRSTMPGARARWSATSRPTSGATRSCKNVPADQTRNFRNDLYLVGEALRLVQKTGKPAIAADDAAVLKNYKKHVDNATKFIPLWVKIAVAIALGLGTMVGWKRIVVTVGEKIGKDHLTYAQGAAAEITAMVTIGAADMYGLPVSTTHVLSSGVAGTMAANHSGLQMSTVRNLLMAWVLTLPVSILLSGHASSGRSRDCSEGARFGRGRDARARCAGAGAMRGRGFRRRRGRRLVVHRATRPMRRPGTRSSWRKSVWPIGKWAMLRAEAVVRHRHPVQPDGEATDSTAHRKEAGSTRGEGRTEPQKAGRRSLDADPHGQDSGAPRVKGYADVDDGCAPCAKG